MKPLPFAVSLVAPLMALWLGACASTRSPLAPGAVARDHGRIGATEGPAWKDGSLYFTDGHTFHHLRQAPLERTGADARLVSHRLEWA